MRFIEEDVSDAVPEIIKVMPTYSKANGLLSFCFVDPFSAKLDFNVFRHLSSRYRMDFLVLLMLGRDIRTNFQRYYQDDTDTRIGDLVADESWRNEWVDRGLRARHLIWFVLTKFSKAMSNLGYQQTTLDEAAPVRIAHGNVLQYYLVLYSKHSLGRKLWRETQKTVDPQMGLEL
ncbi:MAG: three-Cys-motif partner protein TcmP [Gemmatimonadetes bacterium]|nr:three-Cys-motif partner protein TcmP [Gemmatimonadota bacterium]MYF07801.1 three-Cys-motif partner protein TcmP [Rhodospirillaceae bacterium]